MNSTDPLMAKRIQRTIQSLKNNGINAIVVENKEEAKKKVISMIPSGSEVMTMTSVTLDDVGLAEIFNESGNYVSVKSKLALMDREKEGYEMNKMGAAPEYSIGSVHAVTEDGRVLVASNTGSQLPGYAYGSPKVIWVVGAQKIVENMDEGMKRIEEHVLPLESDRARKAYGVAGSNISKVLVINKEVNPQRITMVIVKEAIGF